jgi:hypothetical protein
VRRQKSANIKPNSRSNGFDPDLRFLWEEHQDLVGRIILLSLEHRQLLSTVERRERERG